MAKAEVVSPKGGEPALIVVRCLINSFEATWEIAAMFSKIQIRYHELPS